ncbi:MAG: hypothetical protein ACNA8L_02535 [Luteolibacter sp.]
MQINYQKAKVLCTEAEIKILNMVKPRELVAMKLGELRALAPKARKYSDKWLAQSRKQGNSTDGAGARSFAKHELFKEAVARIDARLGKLALEKPATKQVVKKAGPAKKIAPAKKPAAAKKAPAAKPVAKKAASKKAVKSAAKKVAKKVVSSRARSAMSLATQAKQKSIGTGLRMATSGKNSRVRGHVSAQGRRNQAARSARKR